MARSTREVFEDHLRCRAKGHLEEDLQRNYADDVVILCESGILRGHQGVRQSAAQLDQALPGQEYEYLTKHLDSEYAFLRWRGESAVCRIEHGADSFVIRNGRIVMQSIYYQIQMKT